ncbi:MAG: hypothetical protein WC244_00685 [Patescibacteria group bacterium]|jgi:hypothetical protein
MSNKKLFLILDFVLPFAIFALLHYGNLFYLTFPLCIIWLIANSLLLAPILSNIFPLKKIYLYLLSCFATIFLLGLFANIFCAIFILNNFTILISFLLVAVSSVIWNFVFGDNKENTIILESGRILKGSVFYPIIFVLLSLVGFVTIYISVTEKFITSPWQVLPIWYLGVVFLLSIIIFLMVFGKQKTIWTLIFIIIFSFLLHSYLLVYANGFGGDRWRHLGSEYRIMRGVEYQPTLLTDNIWYSKIGPVQVPRALVDGPKLSYGLQWSINIIASKVSGIDIFFLDKYLMIILWSIFVPILFFVGAIGLWPNKQFALLASALTLVFYPLQYYGSHSLPIGYGWLLFLFLICSWIYYLRRPTGKHFGFNIFLTVLLYFSYSLSLIFGGLMLLVALALRYGNRLVSTLVIIFASISIFVMEMFGSKIVNNFNWINWWRDSNLLFFDFRSYLGLVHYLKYVNYLYYFFSIIFLISVVICLAIWIMKKEKQLRFLAWMFAVAVVNYFLCWNFLSGLHTLSRRLNLFILVFAIFILAWGIIKLREKVRISSLIIILLSIFLVGAYYSGPFQEISVNGDDVVAAKYLWQKIEINSSNYCTLSYTSELLALEAYSGKEVVAGNFPSDFNHQQDERVMYLDLAVNSPSLQVFDKAREISGKNTCFLSLMSSKITLEKIEKINEVLGKGEIIGNNIIWQF